MAVTWYSLVLPTAMIPKCPVLPSIGSGRCFQSSANGNKEKGKKHNTVILISEYCYGWSKNSVVSMATRLWAGRTGIRFPAETGDFSHLQIFQTGPGAQPISYQIGTEVKSPTFI